jgi:hypothetical protein
MAERRREKWMREEDIQVLAATSKTFAKGCGKEIVLDNSNKTSSGCKLPCYRFLDVLGSTIRDMIS